MAEIKNRNEISNEYKWNLEAVYCNTKEFDEEYEKLKKRIIDFKKYEGHTMDNADIFYESMQEEFEIYRILEKLNVYASHSSDADVSDNYYQTLKDRVANLGNLCSENMYFTNVEMLHEDYSKIEKFMIDKPELKEYEKVLKDVYRYKNHTLSDAEEKLLSTLSSTFGNDENTYGYLTDSDMTFGSIKDEDDNIVELTDTNYSIYINSENRKVRIDAFKTLYKYYKQFGNTITATLNGHIKQNVTLSKIKKYSSVLDRSLFYDDITKDVYDTLVNTVHENLDIFQEYFDLKKEVLGLDEMHFYDVYADLVSSSNKKYSFEEAKELVINSLSILGEDYINNLKKAFNEKWIDIYPNKNKRCGAYSGGAYDTYPYVLLNYQGKLDDVSTLAHELGHSMHSFYTRNNQPYQYGDYSIFVAEVASQVNEILLARYIYENSNSKEEKLNILNRLLELLKGSFYRQTMFSEFEDYAYKLIENDDVITASKLQDKYYELNKTYFKDSVVADDEIRYEWEKVPHFFYNYYVYKYATGISAACDIATRILNKEEGALDAYLNMLKSGSRLTPLETLKVAKVDMTDKHVYESCANMFKDTLDEVKILLKK